MTFEQFDREITDLCWKVKMSYMDWTEEVYMGSKTAREDSLEDLVSHLEMATGYLNDIKIVLFHMIGWNKGYERGQEEAQNDARES